MLRGNRLIAVTISLNSGKSLPFVLADIPRNIVDGVLVIDCVSSDDTISAARQGGAMIVTEPSGRQGVAIRRALLQLAEYEPHIVVFLDSYYRYFPSEIKRLVEPIVEAGYDLVLGARVLNGCEGNIFSLASNFWRDRLLSAFQKEVYRFSDVTPFRAIRYSALTQLNLASDDLGWLIEMPVRAFRQGFRICEVPVHYNADAPAFPRKEFDEDSVFGRKRLLSAFAKYQHLLR
ncbi:MAG: hypothetical protein Kow0090_12560 [Myxococcota bacterium]